MFRTKTDGLIEAQRQVFRPAAKTVLNFVAWKAQYNNVEHKEDDDENLK